MSQLATIASTLIIFLAGYVLGQQSQTKINPTNVIETIKKKLRRKPILGAIPVLRQNNEPYRNINKKKKRKWRSFLKGF